MTVDTVVTTFVPTTAVVVTTAPPTVSVVVTETDTVEIQEVGTAGHDGLDGAPGSTGPTGPQGLSAYQLAVQEGFVGTEDEWLLTLVGTAGQQGPQGATGPTGAAGAAGSSSTTYVHHQGVPATTWVIAHGLGFNPNITAVDSVNRRMEGEVTYLDLNTAQLDFSASLGGLAYLS